MILQLTWDGLDLAIDMIAAQCRKTDRCGVFAKPGPDQMLAVPLADRLGLPLMQQPGDFMVMVQAVATDHINLVSVQDPECWAWVDMSPELTCNSILKYQGGVTQVIMPWQQTSGVCGQQFIQGFHD